MSVIVDPVASLQCSAYLGDETPRLLSTTEGREDIVAYRATGGYADLVDPEALARAVLQSGLRGRGGAAFPTGRKIELVRQAPGVPVVVANGEEGEPASAKDRWLLRNRPHLVLDGLRLAAAMVGASEMIVYLSDVPTAASVRLALDELAETGLLATSVRIVEVPSAYVAGEASAVVQAINGGPALPTEKPPRPSEYGVDGRPTLISNVETLANLPIIQAMGVDGYRSLGTEDSPGTFLLTLMGNGASGLIEVPFGVTLRELLTRLGEDLDGISGFLIGGYFAGVLGIHALDIPLDYDAFAAAGAGLGCAAIGVITSDVTCPVAISAGVMAYLARESAGQCGSCFNGTAAMSAVLDALQHHQAEASDIERLRKWAGFLRGRGACGTLDGATNVAASLLREFPDHVAAHLDHACSLCSSSAETVGPPYAVI
jgi:NADH:ubiquinone oxidoreductase subunit F (NADH-binding)